ncbi:MAG TPA: hypothetical protein VHM70_27500 [Polyangiaceae bacterium]|nr:hypothetical protein [Polyangiaceae bacterium]
MSPQTTSPRWVPRAPSVCFSWLECLSAALLSTACLDEPPEYQAAVQIPPIVNFSQVVPSPSVVKQLMTGQDSLHIEVPFRSEDLDEEVLAVLLLDVVPGQLPQVIGDQPIAPSTFADISRTFTADVTDFGAPGCHTLTAMLTHASNASAFRFEVIDESLATRVMWTLAVHEAPGDISLGECPTQGQQ